MKKTTILFLLFILNTVAFSQLYDHRINQFRERIKIAIQSKQDIAKLASVHIEIDRCCGWHEKEVHAYATPQEVELIRWPRH